MQVKLQRFQVPDTVYPVVPPGRRQDGYHPIPGFNLSEIPAEELSELCDDFRAAVFSAARKKDPKGGQKSEHIGFRYVPAWMSDDRKIWAMREGDEYTVYRSAYAFGEIPKDAWGAVSIMGFVKCLKSIPSFVKENQ